MTAKPTIPEARLKEIVDAYRLLLTVPQIENYRKTLLPEEVEALDAYIEGLKPVTPPPEIKVTKPPAGTKSFLGNVGSYFDKNPLKPGETTWDRWNSYKKQSTKEDSKRFEAEIKYTEKRLAELGWEDPNALEKLTEEITGVKKPVVPPQKKPLVAPDLLIARTPYPKWWKDSLNAKINLICPGSATLATLHGNLRLFVSVIVITVTGETAITITFGNAGSSGPIYLGGENQPMGMVIAMGNSPAPCGDGSLSISATDPGGVFPSIGGWATCFAMPEKV